MKPRPSRALAFLLLALSTPASAESPACFLFPGNADEHTCTCGPGPYPDAEGNFNDVWGSVPYSSDSDICRAALHAGVIGPEGGEVTAIRAEPPEGEWRGSTANGVTSFTFTIVGSYSWDSAYTFEGAQAPEPLPNCGPLGEAEEVACYCPHGAPRGEVWGSGPYTADSDICTAALHAGVFGSASVGNVRVIRGPGEDSYTSSTAAAVKTSEHGPADASFTFGAFE